MTGEAGAIESLDELIRDAYAVVAEPESLFDLQLRIEKALHRSGAEIAALDPHFAQIGSMLDRLEPDETLDFTGFGLHHEKASGDTVKRYQSAILTLQDDLQIINADSKFFATGDLAEKGFLPEWVLGNDRQNLRQLRSLGAGKVSNALVLRVYANEHEDRGIVALARRTDGDGQSEIEISRIALEWTDHAGQVFGKAFTLTATELQLARFIVKGRSVNDFAVARGRSVGTARNQMKAVLRKLAIGSQAELVSLYAGFANSLALRELEIEPDRQTAFGRNVHLKDGTQIMFERYGKAGGTPILLLHGAIEGPYLTPNQQHRAQTAGLEIIVPWMPFYSDTGAPEDARERIEWFVERLEAFLDTLEISRCAAIACSLSGAYGLAATRALPERICGLVLSGLPVPLNEVNEHSQLHPAWRAPLILGRVAPRFLDVFMRALLRLAIRGEAYHYFDKLLEGSPADRATIRHPDVAAAVRNAAVNRPDKAGRAMAHAILVSTLDWDEWLYGQEVPVSITIGAQDSVHSPELLLGICKKFGFKPLGPIKNAGGFSFFQVPELILGEARAMMDA